MRSVHPLRGLAIIAAAMSAPAAMATPFFSATNAAYPGEKNQARILRDIYGGNRHAFGWIDSTSAEPTFQTILSNTATFNAPVTVTLSSQFVWALDNQRTGRLFTSDPADNLDRNETPRDQMVSYAVSGPGIAANTFLLFWEDRIPGDSMFDYDYNDAVIELTAVPTPGALALAGIGGLLVIRRKRR